MIEYKLLEPTQENAETLEYLRLKSYGIEPTKEDYDKYYIDNVLNGSFLAFICTLDNIPISGCYISNAFNSIYIEYIFVLPEYQESGLRIGRKLLQYILDNKKIVEDYYHTTFKTSKLYAPQPKSQEIYKKMGYKKQPGTIELLYKKLQ